MLVEQSGGLYYLLTALGAAPDIFDVLLRELTAEEADFRPDPERFSLREIIAHLTDWDGIFLDRVQQTLIKSQPAFEDYETGQRAIDKQYSQTDPQEQSRLFRERRTQMTTLLRSLSPQQWQQHCVHPRLGRVTLEAIITIIPWHDTYHAQQVTEWRRRYTQGLMQKERGD